MGYKALYRTYRPQTFKDIVGQEIIVKTVQQAVKTNKISHAYLFTGPRGTGKTSVARILAKAVNCPNSSNGEPCDVCDVCKSISDGNHPDIIEIDAASNNGVDEIRDIRDKVKFLPGTVRYKVYIIDEVHMLSQGAFNALLKTLEEPPKHVLFILATTEPHKIPLTILSRCQRFDFKSLSIEGIISRLEEVIQKEDIQIEPEAIQTIAESAEGGMRDALGVLDQAVSYSDDIIDVDDVNAVTGNVSIHKIIDLANHFEDRDITKSLSSVNDLLDLGKETSKLVNNLLQFYRDILLFKHIDISQMKKFIFEKPEFQELAKRLEEKKIYHYINQLGDVYNKMKFSNNPRVFLEVALIKMIHDKEYDQDIIARLSEVEQHVQELQTTPPVHDGQSSEYQGVDDQKVTLLETKVNRVISELSRLEIHKIPDEIKELKETKSAATGMDEKSILKLQSLENRIVELKEDFNVQLADKGNKIEELTESLLMLKHTVPNHSAADDQKANDLLHQVHMLKEEIRVIKNEIMVETSRSHSSELADLKQAITELKKQIQNITNKDHTRGGVSEADSTYSDRLEDIEDKLYKLIAGSLHAQTTSMTKNRKTKPANQVTLFGDEVVSLQHLKESKAEIVKEKAVEEKQKETAEIKRQDEVKSEETFTWNIEDDEKIKEKTSTGDLFDTSDTEDEELDFESNQSETEEESEFESNQEEEFTEVIVEEKIIKSDKEEVDTNKIIPKQEPLLEKDKEDANKEEGELTSNTYDVRIIERILHNSRSLESKQLKETLMETWSKMDEVSDPNLVSFAVILKEGTLSVVGEKELIIVFDDEVLVNQVMRPRFKKKAIKLLSEYFGLDVEYYIALPKKDWTEKRTEYIQQYNMGFKHPRLTPIHNPLLKEVFEEDDFVDDKQKTIEKTIEIFGEDLVRVE